MLHLIDRFFDRQRRANDDGAALVLVVFVMLVGAIATATIAAAIFFVISTNSTNKGNTQAFIAAESGRDATFAQLKNSTCTATSLTGTSPSYSSTIYSSPSNTPPPSSDGLTASCPSTSTNFIVIKSQGTSGGQSATIDSVFPYSTTTTTSLGGVVTYFGGSVSTQVSNYVGDLVVRSGNYTCPNSGSITGNLYVTNGNVTLSSGCTITGNIWASGYVDGSSSGITIGGNVKANGYITFASNGTTIGQFSGSTPVAGTGNISSGSDVTLTNTGSTQGRVAGNVQAATATLTVGNKWTVSGTQTPNTPLPAFNPTLATISLASQWIDLDASTTWNAQATANPCAGGFNLSSTLGAATTSVLLNYASCGGTAITVNASSITRDAVFLFPTASRMDVTLSGTLTGGHQLLFVHADASRALSGTPAQPQPTCGNGNQNDKFNVNSASNVTGVKVLLYSPCGLTGTVRSTFDGQLYSASGGLTFGNGANYTCQDMAWPGAFTKLGCIVVGGSDGIITETTTQTLGNLLSQTER
ncbi:hypothetical protein LK09_03970 [Microbacterium mangrovi]|uniref:Uncharacterized protein n=1 Tax=Microbacterium mangrovi TaxID=1348253 RepID=A0A0B2AC61_9MICO|nr:hypothetical protein [Microbacterium mangrovi]KHK99172.1 hypothetical protein LK09_03970 [Microbacterium mangrovi]